MSFDIKDSSESPRKKTIHIGGISENYNRSARFVPVTDYSYHPNFILVDSSHSSNSLSLFGDIVPLNLSQEELVKVIVTSWEALYNLVIQSSTFIVCILSFFNQLVNNAVYQSYVIAISGYQQVATLPDRYSKLKSKYLELLDTVIHSDTRSLWWLEVKIDIRQRLEKLTRLYGQVWNIIQKFYLASIVLFCVIFLNIGSSLQTPSSSFLLNFLQNNSISAPINSVNSADTMYSNIAVAHAISSGEAITKIIEHEVNADDSIEIIADIYGISVETLRINNNGLENGITPGQKLYVPWNEGYIYSAEKEITAEELSNIFNLDKQQIIDDNIAIYNQDTQKFAQNSLILLPTTDYTSVQESIQKEAERVQGLKAAEEMNRRRQQNLALSSVQATTYKEVVSDAARNDFLTWPTSGTISRCYQPGHLACDIANFSAPPIFASQSGIVSIVGWEPGGYGNHIIIDHGTINGANIKTLYAHLSEVYVSQGQSVQQNQSIGKMGMTGYSTGIHLHYEVIINGVRQPNPLAYLP